MSDFNVEGRIAARVVVTDWEMGQALLMRAHEMVRIEDDASMDWVTDANGWTYIGDHEWKVSSDPQVAALVDAGHILSGHGLMRLPVAVEAAAPALRDVAVRLIEANQHARSDTDFIAKIALVCEYAKAALAKVEAQ